MDSIRVERKALQRQAVKPLGYSTNLERVFGVQVKGLGNELDAMALPVGGCSTIQDALGRDYFVVGISFPGDGSIVQGSAEDTDPW